MDVVKETYVRVSVCVCESACVCVCSDRSDGCSVVSLHLDPGHHLQHGVDTSALPTTETGVCVCDDSSY